jgi:uncharacterized protein (DUF2235 family)
MRAAIEHEDDMPKNIVVCCDGTANEFAKDRTNVIKLFYTLEKDSSLQIVYYHPGVGTMAPPGVVSKTGAFFARTAGLAFGYGLNHDIEKAYCFIARNFVAGDRLFLFGFSRGAYTVRALASLLYMYGVVPAGNEPLAPYAIRMMWTIRELRKKAGTSSGRAIDEYFDLAREFKDTVSRPCKPYFVGVWDTVSSVGWFTNPVSLPYTASNPEIQIGRHAVAIDERRAFFRTNLWRPAAKPDEAGPKDLKQVWFPGVHCDVGGGYPEAESGLSKIALQWMISEARAAGLITVDEKVSTVLGARDQGFVAPNANGKMHESLNKWWRPIEYVPKPHWNRARQRTWPPQPWVHDAAWEREGGRYAERLPRDAVRLSVAEGGRLA